ncbi:pilus assembly protein [Janibacter sp. YIM B02568]|uniref:TadE/TadG family type IV pilus assembly protein n=1 Tax=Janibacter endophyticus TaxID=2806261 RepID=UPI00194E31C3|nr:TadE/TadG family type IV pilus assembly protein [Janibacter endophyticus]MBM6546890.1 pilus assembly protein [Janibacter endophyticus]
MSRLREEKGAAVVDFALTSGLLALLFAAVLQLGAALHIRNTLVSCASEGARHAARVGSSPEQGVARTEDLIRRAVSDGYADDVSASVEQTPDGVEVVVVRVRAPLPVLGPLGPDGALDVTGRAFLEEQ